jgi:hypothetical protein
VLHQLNQLIFPCRQLLNGFTNRSAALLASAGLLIGGAVTVPGASPALASIAKVPTHTSAPSIAELPNLPNGIYLYGQSPETEQIGNAYMVFEVRQDRTIGAFYMPRSSFDCFYGNIEGDRLAVNIVDSYENTTYAYAVPRADYELASSDPTGDIEFQGFHRIANVSENDRRILETCKQALPDV